MPLKIEFALKFFTALKYFYLSGFLRNLRLLWKQSLSWNFSLYLIHFLHPRMFEQLLLALKNRVCPEFTVMNVFFILQKFEQPALALENRICPGIFHCSEIFFTSQDFWETWACPKNRVPIYTSQKPLWPAINFPMWKWPATLKRLGRPGLYDSVKAADLAYKSLRILLAILV